MDSSLITVQAAADLLSASRWTVYRLIWDNAVQSVQIGRSSVRRDHELSIGCTHTNGMSRSAANRPSTRHRCPVGSHATDTPAKPFAVARCVAQSSAAPRSQARQRNVLRANTFES